jgi:hypothetical protein
MRACMFKNVALGTHETITALNLVFIAKLMHHRTSAAAVHVRRRGVRGTCCTRARQAGRSEADAGRRTPVLADLTPTVARARASIIANACVTLL